MMKDFVVGVKSLLTKYIKDCGKTSVTRMFYIYK